MDEIDSIGSARMDSSGGGGDSEVQRTMLELIDCHVGRQMVDAIDGLCE